MTRASLAAAALGAAVLAAPSLGHAQRAAESFVMADAHDHVVRAGFEMDPAFAVGVGYVGTVPLEIGGFRRRLALRGDVTAITSFSSWDFVGGAGIFLAEGFGFNVLTTLDLELKVVQNEVHVGLAYGYGLSVRPGWYDPAWYLAAELALHGTFAATYWHRDTYREIFAEVQDGTYLTGNLAFFFGGTVGFRIEERVLLGLRFAWRFPYTFDPYAPYVQAYTFGIETGVEL